MPSYLHKTVTRAVEYELKKVLQLYMPNAPENEFRMLSGSSNLPLFSVVTYFSQNSLLKTFKGKPMAVSVFQK